MASDDKKPKKGDEPKKKKPAQPEDDFGDNIKLGDAADVIDTVTRVGYRLAPVVAD